VATIRAHFDGRVFVPDEPVNLAPAQKVELTVHELPAVDLSPAHPRGSPAAVLEAMKSLPPIPREWVDELDRAIEAGKQLPTDNGVFDDLRDE